MADKKYHHVTLTIEDTVLVDLATAVSLRGMCGQGGTVVESFVGKLVTQVRDGERTIRFEYKDGTRGQ